MMPIPWQYGNSKQYMAQQVDKVMHNVDEEVTNGKVVQELYGVLKLVIVLATAFVIVSFGR